MLTHLVGVVCTILTNFLDIIFASHDGGIAPYSHNVSFTGTAFFIVTNYRPTNTWALSLCTPKKPASASWHNGIEYDIHHGVLERRVGPFKHRPIPLHSTIDVSHGFGGAKAQSAAMPISATPRFYRSSGQF